MKRFAELYAELDGSTSTLAKVDAMRRYFQSAPPQDAAWAVYFLAGGKPRQAANARVLRDAAREAAGIPEWLFDEAYHAVGDLAEAIAHMLPDGPVDDPLGLDAWMRERIGTLKGLTPEAQATLLRQWWSALDWRGRFVLNKLITGAFRVGVSRLLVIRALAEAFSLEPQLLAQRIIGYTDARRNPDAERFESLVSQPDLYAASAADAGRPYPFFLAQSLQDDPAGRLGAATDWLVEWKWDGIRGQLVRRQGATWLWSRGEELVTERFPEIADASFALADGTVVDGEILAWDAQAQRPLPFAVLQQRIGRKAVDAKLLRDAPAAIVAYDLLEHEGQDLRERPQIERRALLERVVAQAAHPLVALSTLVTADAWSDYARLREASRSNGVEGFMLKRKDARYGIGRTKATSRGEWWKWKIDPYAVDAVLIYAQPGHGKRASLYTDYTFAVWEDRPDGSRALVPFAKAYSGLTDEEIRRVDAIIRRTTTEKFGPVRSVTPTLVMELGFEGIQKSPRHKSGIAVRFPRILRWREDKPVAEADTLASLHALLGQGG